MKRNSDSDDQTDVARRLATTGLFTAASLVALGACVEPGAEPGADPEPAEATVSALAGTQFSWVDTMANLRGIPHVTNAPIAVLEGWTIANDGGGGVFCWVAGSRENDNNGTIIRPSNVLPTGQGRWKRLFSGPLNVRWFGAGLGGADDAPKIQAVIDLVAAQGGGTIFFPAATYKLGTALVINAHHIRIIGQGRTATTFAKAAPNATVFELRNASFCEICDVGFQMQAEDFATDGAAILFTGGAIRPTLRRVYMFRMWQGIVCGTRLAVLSQVHEAVIYDIKMEAMLVYGMKLFFGTGTSRCASRVPASRLVEVMQPVRPELQIEIEAMAVAR